ncbi:RimK/LysX family protein [Haloferula chungangensis]|uniref:RimK/LysX family protein n=1 Tax=Haloferula chungangensis TaxID=1048331 RepID=A0ABW2L4H0_9BACT
MTNKSKASTVLICLLYLFCGGGLVTAADNAVTEEKPQKVEQSESKPKPESEPKPSEEKKAEEPDDAKKADDSKEPAKEEKTEPGDKEEPKNAEDAEAVIAVARPVSADPVQVYGWRENVIVSDGKIEEELQAKLDTGALTSSIHAEEKELFERDGKKWVRFIVTDPGEKDSQRLRIEAPLVRIALIKEPAGESEAREVVRLGFKIGDRKLKADFTLNNRSNMLSPILIGRTTIKELGWVDPSRAYLADKKVMR